MTPPYHPEPREARWFRWRNPQHPGTTMYDRNGEVTRDRERLYREMEEEVRRVNDYIVYGRRGDELSGWARFLLGLLAFVLAAAMVFFLIGVVVLAFYGMAHGAPAPFRKPTPVRPVKAADLVGKWKMRWGSAPWAVTFTKDGVYRAVASDVSSFHGTWGLDRDGILWIKESCTPSKPDTYNTYRMEWVVPLKRGKMRQVKDGEADGFPFDVEFVRVEEAAKEALPPPSTDEED